MYIYIYIKMRIFSWFMLDWNWLRWCQDVVPNVNLYRPETLVNSNQSSTRLKGSMQRGRGWKSLERFYLRISGIPWNGCFPNRSHTTRLSEIPHLARNRLALDLHQWARLRPVRSCGRNWGLKRAFLHQSVWWAPLCLRQLTCNKPLINHYPRMS